MLIYSASTVGAAWVMNRRRLYRRAALPLAADEVKLLTPYFGTAMLDRVRVMRVEQIPNPLAYSLLPLIGRRPPMDLASVSGMAFADTIVLATPKRGIDPAGLLFHELVHIAQYQMLGIRRFVGDYLRGWLENGRNYFAIPLECQAFELQDRFLAGSGEFDVHFELERKMKMNSEDRA